MAPFASCPGLQAVCEINVPNNIQPSNTLKLSKNVRQEDAVAVVLESIWCPGGEHLNSKCTVKDLHICFRWAVCSNVCSSVFADQLFLFLRAMFKLSSTDKIRKLFNGNIMLTGSTVSSLSVLFVLSTRTSSLSAFPEPRGEGSRHLASLPFYLPAYHPVCSMTVVVAGFRAWKFWHVSFPCSLSNVQPLRRIVREDLLSFCCWTNTCRLFVRRGFLIGFVLFSSLSSTKLLYCCIPLVMAELRTVMAAASTMTLESRAKRHPPSSSNWCPASSDVWPFILVALCGAGWQVLLHLHFLLPSHCTAHVLGHEKGRHVFCTTNQPLPPIWYMSRRYTNNHLA